MHKNIEYEDWSRKTSCPLSCLFLKYFLTDLPISQNKEVSYWRGSDWKEQTNNKIRHWPTGTWLMRRGKSWFKKIHEFENVSFRIPLSNQILMTVTHPGTIAHTCCLTFTCSVTGIYLFHHIFDCFMFISWWWRWQI